MHFIYDKGIEEKSDLIHLIVNRQELLYDLYALTQAFYPGVELDTCVSTDTDISTDTGVSAKTSVPDGIVKESVDGEGQPDEEAQYRCGADMEARYPIGRFQDTIEVCLFDRGARLAITVGEILTEGRSREYTEEMLVKEAAVFLKMGMDGAAARKRALKNLFYDTMAQYTGRELPWGNLTGIRPTKLIRGLIEDNTEKIHDLMENNTEKKQVLIENDVEKVTAAQLYEMHRLKGEKLALGMEIAKLQENILSKLHGLQGYSVYIGIPFCPSRCLYCSFTSNPVDKWKKRIPEYLDALRRELIYVADAAYFRKRILDTVYIGGGTPTALSAEELDRLLGDVTSILPMEDVQEFTVEAGRADSITEEKLNVLRKYHVTRISVNPQTMKEETLCKIGRRHTVEEVKEAFAKARAAGFDNINMDIILGLPGETDEDVANTIREIEKLSPDSLTVHSLAVKRAAGLKDWYKSEGDPRSGAAQDVQRMMEQAMRTAAEGAGEMGMEPYYLYRQKNMAGNLENTGYALSGKYGLYNILIMEEVQSIVALGAGSVSKRVDGDGRIERCDNVKDIGLYLEKIDEMIGRKKELY